MKQAEREAPPGATEQQGGAQLIREEEQHGFTHFLHRLTTRLPLLPIALLALFSHLLVYALSYGGLWGQLCIGALWGLSVRFFAWEIATNFARASNGRSDWRSFLLGFPSGETVSFGGGLWAFVSFASAFSVILVTTAALIVVPFAIKFLATLLFVDGCMAWTDSCRLNKVYAVIMCSGLVMFAWVVLFYRPGVYGATVRRFEHQSRPYMVMLLSVEALLWDRDEPDVLKQAGRDYYGFSTAVAAGTAEPGVLSQMRQYWAGFFEQNPKTKERIRGTVAFAWCGIRPHVKKGSLKRLYVIATQRSRKVENLYCVQKCYEAFRVLAAESELPQREFEILVVHFGADGAPMISELHKLIGDYKQQAESPLVDKPMPEASPQSTNGAQPQPNPAPSTGKTEAAAGASEFENVQLLASALREVENHIRVRAGASKWIFDPAAQLMIDITGGQKIASTVGLLHGYGRPMLAQYVQTENPYGILTLDALPRPGPHL